MSRIDKLIAKLCPDGVEHLFIGDICEVLTGGDTPNNYIKGLTKPSDEFPYPIYSNGIEIYGYSDSYRVGKDAVSISSIGNVGHVAFRKAFFTPIIRLKVLIPKLETLNTRYLYYALLNVNFVGTNSSLSSMKADDVKKYRIPIPPLPIQQEIVRILDTFTDLDAELQAELEARKKQYEHYRNQLLNFEGKEVELKMLGEVSSYPNKRISVNGINEDNYVGVDNLLQNKQGKTTSNCVPKSGNLIAYKCNDILIGNIRPYLKKIWLATNNGGTNGDVVVIRINNDSNLLSKYLYYILSSDSFFDYNKQFAKGGKMPRGDKKQILKYKVPIPPLSEQERIVTILDKFEALVNEELPAEIAARRKQYEHYREKLLTFEPLIS